MDLKWLALARELGSHTTAKLALRHFRSPTTFLLTPATYPHSTNTHYIQYAL